MKRNVRLVVCVLKHVQRTSLRLCHLALKLELIVTLKRRVKIHVKHVLLDVLDVVNVQKHVTTMPLNSLTVLPTSITANVPNVVPVSKPAQPTQSHYINKKLTSRSDRGLLFYAL